MVSLRTGKSKYWIVNCVYYGAPEGVLASVKYLGVINTEVGFKSMVLNEITVDVIENWEEDQGLIPKPLYMIKTR